MFVSLCFRSNEETIIIDATASKVDYRSTNMEQFCRTYDWLYYNHAEGGYKCKYCELFPATGPGAQKEFSVSAVTLGDHPKRQLKGHDDSTKHSKAKNCYNGTCFDYECLLISYEADYLQNEL